MKKSRPALATMAVALAATFVALQPVAAQAEDPWDTTRSALLNVGVQVSHIEPLIEKLQDGEPLDSMAGVAPVSVESFEEDGYAVTKSTYGDGSVSVTSAEIGAEVPSGSITPMAGISGCIQTGPGTVRTYTNCHVDHSTGIVNGSFKAEYQIWESTTDKIIWVDDALTSCFWPATSCTGETVVIQRASENFGTGLPAQARYSVSITGTGVSGTGTIYLRVGGNAATATGSF